MQSFSIENSAFKKVALLKQDIFSITQMHVINLIALKKQFSIRSHASTLNYPPIIRYFIDILLTLIKNAKGENRQEGFDKEMEEKIITSEIPLSLVQQIFQVIQAKLPQPQDKDKLKQQLSQSMLFDKGFFDLFKSCICEQKNYLILNNLKQFYENIRSKFGHHKIMEKIYYMHGGSLKTIEKSTFSNNVKFVIWTVGKIFTSTNNFINRNFKLIKKQNSESKIIDSSIRIICNYQNNIFIQNQIKDLTQIIFKEKQFLEKNEFFLKLQSVTNHPILWLYSDLLSVEASLLESSSFRQQIIKREGANQTNFYTQEMQKLLKKCPYNGDQKCDCKKCNCVRRNRESAKLSQQKKRNAVEQIGPLQDRLDYLEKRNKQLQQENKILKTLMSELKNNPNMRSVVEPMNKVFNDQ